MDKSEAEDAEGAVPQKEIEYETEFFGFSPQSLVDTIYNTTLHYIQETFDAMKKAILKQFPDQITEPEANEGIRNIVNYVEKKAETPFNKLEAYLTDEIFKVPVYVVLDSDKIQLDPIADMSRCEEVQLEQEIQEKEERIAALLSFNEELRQELLQIEETERHYNEFLRQMPEVVAIAEQQIQAEADLQDTISSVMENLSV